MCEGEGEEEKAVVACMIGKARTAQMEVIKRAMRWPRGELRRDA
jgi:hypothetical protein